MGLPTMPDGTPLFAIPGLVPSKKVDIPISAIFIAILACLAVRNVYLFKTDKKQGYLFPMSMVLFGFCMARISTFSMRIAWAVHPKNDDLAIAAQIFSAAGVVLLYVINIILAQRLLGSLHPLIGQMKPVKAFFVAYILSLIVVLVLVIISTVRFFEGKQLTEWQIEVRKVGPVYFTVFAFLAVPVALLALLLPQSDEPRPLGRDGGAVRPKSLIIFIAAVPLTLGAAVRASGGFLPPRFYNDPAWYQTKAAFYIFMIVCELIAVAAFMIGRFDLKFYVGENAVPQGGVVAGKSSDEENGYSSSSEVRDAAGVEEKK